MKLVTTAQMRELDRRTIELGTPGIELMERAGRGIARILLERHRAACKRGVLVVAGRGNNGGDGFVVARLLAKRGIRCRVVLLGERSALRGDARTNADRWAKARGSVREVASLDDATRTELARELAGAGLVLDGIFGSGLARPVEGLASEVIASINAASAGENRARMRVERMRARKGKRAAADTGPPPVVVAIDVPSGLDADTGLPLGIAVRAQATITLGAHKPGLVLPSAQAYVGELALVEIGLAEEALASVEPAGTRGDADELAALVPGRDAAAHKGSNGHLLIVAGSVGKSGAAILCGRAALRGGAGLVTVACAAEILPIVASSMPELMTDPLPERFVEGEWRARLEGKAALVVGPGLGTSASAQQLVRWLVARAGVPMVVDADGLNALASDLAVLRRASAPVVLTPHPGEMSRLTGLATTDVQAQRIEHARALARDTGAVVVLKGSGTIVAAPDERWSINASGGPLLGVGGTGDVLAGLVGSLLAQGLPPYDAARLGVFLHGRAGDLLAVQLGDAGLLASQLADELPVARRTLAAGDDTIAGK
ncbi:NAD(P)H-hydrate dehydratase [Candidatus Binatia bacterium]|nr:NAD(P)H-hydrate dehydratase [Candidatus Binatia bacterium]